MNGAFELQDAEKRIQELEKQVQELGKRAVALESLTNQFITLVPNPSWIRDEDNINRIVDNVRESMRKLGVKPWDETPPVDRSATILTNGDPVDDAHRELQPNGQQKAYVVLTPEERRKGFVRPVLRTYTHVGPKIPGNLRDLTEEEHQRYDQHGYVKYQSYTNEEREKRGGSVVGRFWTQSMLDAKGCGQDTTMSQDIAETFARDPGFYSGGGFCCTCRRHVPNEELVWKGTDEQVGS
jgi:hypothetical protein